MSEHEEADQDEVAEPAQGEREASPVEPIQGERPHMHRAFCLWLMQDEDARSIRAVARAVGRGGTTVREWKQTRDWDGRAIQLGASGQPLAVRQYRERYYKRYGQREIAMVEPRMSVPFLETELPLPDRALASGEAERTENRHALDLDDRKREASRHLKLLDGVIGTFVNQLKGGKVKVGVREAVHVIKLRHELADLVHGTPGNDAAQPVVESARVRIARANGEDVVDAMYEDAEELLLIFGHLRDRNGNQEPAGEVVELAEVKGAG